jgi:hypothetical protein
MSFTTPRNVPNFASATRRHEDVYWSSSGRSRYTSGSSNGGGLSISPFPFRGRDRELPMYKDKPYSYHFARRRRSWRFWVSLVLLLLFCWLYLAPRLRHGRDHAKKPTKSASHATWAQRRQDVVGAMKKSWGGYEKYAWGMCSGGMNRTGLTETRQGRVLPEYQIRTIHGPANGPWLDHRGCARHADAHELDHTAKPSAGVDIHNANV